METNRHYFICQKIFTTLTLYTTFLVLIFGAGYVKAGETVDVMVLYSPAAQQNISEKNIVHAILNTNTVFRNSGIDTRLRLVYTAPINFNELDFSDADVALLSMESKTDGIIDQIHTLRNQNGADLVILIVNATGIWNGWTGGDANVLYRNDPSLSEYAPFAMVDWQNLDSTAFTHEIAHTMGAHHDWYVSSEKKVPYPYARGYVNLNQGWRTIMAYENECLDHGKTCPRIPFFSNPNLKYNGVPMGIPIGTNINCQNGVTANPPCDAYDALAIINTSQTFAAFRPEFWQKLNQPVPSSPLNSTVLNTYTPQFTWKHNPAISQYALMIGLSPDGSGLAFMNGAKNILTYQSFKAADICRKGICNASPRMSNSNGRHYWSVWGNNTSGWSIWTDPSDFTLFSTAMKGAVDVKPLSPTSDQVVGNLPTFTWEATIGGPGIPDAKDYRILVWDRINNLTVYSTEWMPANTVCNGGKTCQATPNISLPPGKYLWRIRARGLYGDGIYNTRLYFIVN